MPRLGSVFLLSLRMCLHADCLPRWTQPCVEYTFPRGVKLSSATLWVSFQTCPTSWSMPSRSASGLAPHKGHAGWTHMLLCTMPSTCCTAIAITITVETGSHKCYSATCSFDNTEGVLTQPNCSRFCSSSTLSSVYSTRCLSHSGGSMFTLQSTGCRPHWRRCAKLICCCMCWMPALLMYNISAALSCRSAAFGPHSCILSRQEKKTNVTVIVALGMGRVH